MTETEPASEEPVPLAGASEPLAAPGGTVGTGSVIGIGCAVGAIVLVLIAVAIRVFTGIW